MMLLLDCGNTRLKWGVRKGSAWLATGALPIDAAASLHAALPPGLSVEHACGCIVADGAVAAALETSLGIPVTWIAARPTQCGVANGYADPAQLGADRWAALVGARALHRGACLVINAGTATTIDVLRADGGFAGGVILPGLALMRASLARNTARLPLIEGSYRALPDNTRDAISSGAVHATVGAMERMFAHIASEPDPVCLLAGGAADQLAPAVSLPLRRVEHLVLEGLARIVGEQTC